MTDLTESQRVIAERDRLEAAHTQLREAARAALVAASDKDKVLISRGLLDALRALDAALTLGEPR